MADIEETEGCPQCDDTLVPWTDGMNACMLGHSKDNCPYESNQAIAWYEGYDIAAMMMPTKGTC